MKMMCRLGVEGEQPDNKNTRKRCILRAIEWWLYLQVVGVQQQYTMVKTTIADSIPLSPSEADSLTYTSWMCWRLELLRRLSDCLFGTSTPSLTPT